ncbi:unnamed protein product [Prunus armeniaca]
MLLATSEFAAIVRGITSLNGAWDPEATWRFNHSIFGRVSYGLRLWPIIPRSRDREDSAFAAFLLFSGRRNVEAIPLRNATGAAVSNFIREYIVCRFGIPYKMVTDNGTPFVNKQVSSTLSRYGIKHRRSTPYYPQGNGQAEATNKTILRILSKMVYEYQGGWSVQMLCGLTAPHQGAL